MCFPTTMAADGPESEYPLPPPEAAMHCLRGKGLPFILARNLTQAI